MMIATLKDFTIGNACTALDSVSTMIYEYSRGIEEVYSESKETARFAVGLVEVFYGQEDGSTKHKEAMQAIGNQYWRRDKTLRGAKNKHHEQSKDN